ncbi:DUF3325 domain-containing protein [Comamonas aquatilis]|uniref:DUF3325 domain-containing protein n=1 Tax=Comamonas aquatilis TaxID=1778406 RepID=UPI0039EFF194
MSMLQAALAAWALAWAGMTALAFAMERHYQQLTGNMTQPRLHRYVLRTAGALLLAACLLVCLVGWGTSVGVVAWLGWLSLGAFTSTLLVGIWPRRAM